jgi:hypothetical protein
VNRQADLLVGKDFENVWREDEEKKWEPVVYLGYGMANCRANSVRFVFLDPGLVAGEEDSTAFEFFLWQEMAHQRLWYCGSSHIFVQCFTPVSYAQWQ